MNFVWKFDPPVENLFNFNFIVSFKSRLKSKMFRVDGEINEIWTNILDVYDDGSSKCNVYC